ncbi:MAG: hypothetical protein ACI4V1_04865 [Eubacteriales bacterium]
MNTINWKQKLTSRKLWAAVVGVVVGLAAAFGIDENEYAQVVGVVTSLVSVVGYIFGEAKVDAARIESDGIRDIIESAENELKED